MAKGVSHGVTGIKVLKPLDRDKKWDGDFSVNFVDYNINAEFLERAFRHSRLFFRRSGWSNSTR